MINSMDIHLVINRLLMTPLKMITLAFARARLIIYLDGSKYWVNV